MHYKHSYRIYLALEHIVKQQEYRTVELRITRVPRQLELNFVSLDQNHFTESYPAGELEFLATQTVFRFPSIQSSSYRGSTVHIMFHYEDSLPMYIYICIYKYLYSG